MKTLTINMKRSGNYIVTEYTRPEWTVVGTANSPKELMEKINQLGNATIIKSEYCSTKAIQQREKTNKMKTYKITGTGLSGNTVYYSLDKEVIAIGKVVDEETITHYDEAQANRALENANENYPQLNFKLEIGEEETIAE